MPLPAIAHLKTEEGLGHFVVLYEVKGDKIAAGTGALQRTDPQTARFIEWQQSQPPLK